VTLDSTSDSTPTAAEQGGEATAAARPKRAPRTRATRATKPAGEPAAAEAAAPAADLPAADVPAADVPADEAPAKPVRRRATRKTAAEKAAEVAAAESAPVADVAAPAAAAPGATAQEAPAEPAAPKRRRSTRTAAAPGAPAAEQPATLFADEAPAAETVATEPAAAQPVVAEAVVAEPVAAQPVVAEPVAAAAEPAGSRPRRSRRATRPAGAGAEVAAVQPAAVQPVAARPAAQPAPEAPAALAEPVIEEPEDEEVAEAVEQAEQTSAAAPASRLDVLAELGRGTAREPAAPAAQPESAPEEPARARRSGRGQQSQPQQSEQERPATARLATTALLFQAPEAPRRRRRAQAPTGSPEAISAAAQAEVDAAAAAAAEAAAEPSAGEAPAPSRRRGRGRGRARVEEQVEPAEVEPADEAEELETADAALETADEDAEQVDRDETDDEGAPRRRRRRGGRGRRSRGGAESDADAGDDEAEQDEPSSDEPARAESDEPAEDAEDESDEQADGEESGGSSRRRRRRRRSGRGGDAAEAEPAPSRSRSGSRGSDEVTALRGSTRLEAKRQRRREGRDAGRRRQIITEAEFLARREAVERSMIVRESNGRTQIAVLEDGVLVEHYVSRQAQVSMAGNVYLGRVQNVLPSMEAAFVDVGKGRNAVLYAGEVNWDAAGLEGQPRRIEQALKSGDSVLVQVTKDPIGHKGARLTSQITLAGRYLVYVPGGGMTGISRKLPENERARLKKILREVVPDSAGVIVRTAAEGASEDELRADIARLQSQWEAIEKKAKTANAPALLQGEPDMAIRVVRDIFNDDFSSLVVQGEEAWSTISGYIGELAPDLAEKVSKYTGQGDVFAAHRVDEQLAKGMDRKVWLPSGGSLVIDRTEAMTVVDVNTGKFTGAGGTLEETVTRNNLEAAEEIVRQLRLRDIGGIIVIDFIDMVLESNRDLVLRRLVECLGRDRTKHQVAEVTSLGLVQMTRKRVGQGLVEAFSETCEHCNGRGFVVHTDPVEKSNGRPDAGAPQQAPEGEAKKARRKRGGAKEQAPASSGTTPAVPVLPEAREAVKATLATIAAAAAHAHVHDDEAHAAAADGTAADVAEPTASATSEPEAHEVPQPAVPTEDAVPAQAEAAAQAAPAVQEPVLDVLAALGDLATRVPADGPEPHLELTPVDPGLFELPDASDPDDES
jgi:ribonuclease E